jgi:phosphoserine aminotransferase
MRYFTPGPTQLHPLIPGLIAEALQREIASISHRSKEFEAIYERATTGLRTLLELPDTHQIFFLASANEGWERSIQSCARMHTFHLVQGVFAERYSGISKELGKVPHLHKVPAGEVVNLTEIAVPQESELYGSKRDQHRRCNPRSGN